MENMYSNTEWKTLTAKQREEFKAAFLRKSETKNDNENIDTYETNQNLKTSFSYDRESEKY